ncbi:MAG TPA: dipeptidase, partial [Gemmatimonadales bacterium]|nr:dipeptidase [Gemmatimonadales bacterium]
ADLHADSLLWGRDLLRRSRRGHVDLPRLVEGNVALQVFTVVSAMPFFANPWRTPAVADMVTALGVLQRWPFRTWPSRYQRARYHAERLHRFAVASDGRLVIVRRAADLDRAAGGLRVAALLGSEGAQVLEGKLENVDALFDAGFRLLGLTHFFDNEVAGSAHGWRKGGLTPLGRQVIARMEQLGMIVDLAHASPATLDEVTALAARPVLVSHAGVCGTCDNPRNLTDDQLRRVASTGGLVGITFFRYATGGTTADAIVRAIRHAADTVGVDHVALGSDWDGAVRTPFDASGLPVLTDGLLAAGFAEDEIAAVMGENVRRVLKTILPTAGGREGGRAGEREGGRA